MLVIVGMEAVIKAVVTEVYTEAAGDALEMTEGWNKGVKAGSTLTVVVSKVLLTAWMIAVIVSGTSKLATAMGMGAALATRARTKQEDMRTKLVVQIMGSGRWGIWEGLERSRKALYILELESGLVDI